jgi:hypothetical protein
MKKVKGGERRRYLFCSGGSCERERSQRAACPDPEPPGGPPPGPGDRRVVAAASATQASRIFAYKKNVLKDMGSITLYS